MPNGFKNFHAFLPHNWLGLTGLKRLFTMLFYATLFVGVYAAFNWLATFWTDPATLAAQSAPLRRIYGLAALQAMLACVGWSLFICLLGTLAQILSKADPRN